MNRKRLAQMLSLGGMLLFGLLWISLWVYTDVMKGLLSDTVNYNIVFYVSSLLLAMGLFLLFYFLFSRRKGNAAERENKLRERGLAVAAYLFLLVFLGILFLFEPDMPYAWVVYMPWHSKHHVEVLVLLAAILLTYVIADALAGNSFGESRVKLWPLWICLALFAGWGVYQTNCFNEWYDTVHFDAWFTSVYRVLHLQPFTELNAGCYGFYGILLAPFVKLLGGDVRACMLALGGLTVASVLGYYYALDNLVKSAWLKAVCGVGMIAGLVATISTIRVQGFPHRYIFGGLVLAFLAWRLKHAGKKWLWNMVGFVLVVLSLVWNLETGVGCLLAFVGSDIVGFLQTHRLQEGKLWLKIGKEICLVPLALFGAYGLVGLYDLWVSGRFVSLKAFLFPFVGSSLGDYGFSLPKLPGAWIAVLLLFFIAIAVVVMSTALCGQRGRDEQTILLAAVTILGAVQMVYYINSPSCFYLYIVLPVSVMLMAYLAESAIKRGVFQRNRLGDGILRAFSSVTIMVLVFLAVGTVGAGFKVDEDKNRNRDMGSMLEFAETLRQELPENTTGFGIGIPVLYSILEWDAGYYGVDMAEFRFLPGKMQLEICQWLNQSGDILVCTKTIEEWIIPYVGEGALADFYATHTLASSYELNGQVFGYYTRNTK